MKKPRTDYKICPYCGAALDTGEKCDCRPESATRRPPERPQSDFSAAGAAFTYRHAKTAQKGA